MDRQVQHTMNTMRQILRLHGIPSLEAMDYDDRIAVAVDGDLPLCIEKVGEHGGAAEQAASSTSAAQEVTA